MIPDPHCDDPAAWSFNGFGASVSGGNIRLVNANIVSSDTVPHVAAIIGLAYRYRIVVSTYAASPFTARVRWGGQEIYNKNGAGTFYGEVTASAATGLVFQAQLAGQWFIDDIQVYPVHVRESIRGAVKAAVTGLATTAARVYPSIVYNLQESQLPALQIITGEESIDLTSGTLDAPQRLLQITIKGTAQAVSGLDDTLDDIAEEVETAMATDVTLGGYSHGVDLQSTTFDFSGEGDKPVASVTLTYSILYRTPFGDPTTVA